MFRQKLGGSGVRVAGLSQVVVRQSISQREPAAWSQASSALA